MVSSRFRGLFSPFSSVVLFILLGGCPGAVDNAPVTVELNNATDVPVDALLWSDPGTLTDPASVAVPANIIDTGGTLAPGDTVTVTLACIDAGTLLADGDFLAPGATVPSPNIILLRESEHYFCGDTVSFFYETDGSGGFFISADVNGINIAP